MRVVCQALFDPGNAPGSRRALHRYTARVRVPWPAETAPAIADSRWRSDCSTLLTARSGNHRRGFPKSGATRICAVLLDQSRKADAAAPLAAMTRDVEQVELALQLAERDRSAVAHSRNPNPASASTISISHIFSMSRRALGSPKSMSFQIRVSRTGLAPATRRVCMVASR